MKKTILLTSLSILIIASACKKDVVEPITIDYDYHAHILAPNTDDKHMEDTINIKVNFESHTGETIHHIKVRIYNKSDKTEIFNEPGTAHVHETSGDYIFQKELILSTDNGFSAHSDWILEAKVWGEQEGQGEEIETTEFHVHP